MTYASPFHRLVLIGTLYDDIFNTSLTIAPVSGTGILGLPPADAGLAASMSLIIDDYWGIDAAGGGLGIHKNALLTGFKLNAIGSDGLYATSDPNEFTYPTPLVGGGNFNAPAQLATVVTHRTAVDRGRASKGRAFLPVCDGYQAPAADGRATEAAASRVANAWAAMIGDINDLYASARTGDEALGVVSVMSNIGAGTTRAVTRVTTGRVTDTVRSRRNKISESPIEADVP